MGIPANGRDGWIRASQRIFRVDAERACQALSSLPQGTLDQVLAQLLERKASLLRVAVPPSPEAIPGVRENADSRLIGPQFVIGLLTAMAVCLLLNPPAWLTVLMRRLFAG